MVTSDFLPAGPAIVKLSKGGHGRLRLYCFSYAGGGPLSFRQWPLLMPEEVELCAIRLPGHESRIGETPLTSISSVVAALEAELTPHLEIPYAFFGHSMGALIAFEMARQLRRHKAQVPVALFFSGRRPPHCEPRPPIMHLLPEDDFVKELERMNGTPPGLFQAPELAAVLLPVLRADFAACETYQYNPEPPLDCPVHVMGGRDDEISLPELEGWAAYSTHPVSVELFPGDHFYINSSRHLLTSAVCRHLDSHLRAVEDTATKGLGKQ